MSNILLAWQTSFFLIKCNYNVIKNNYLYGTLLIFVHLKSNAIKSQVLCDKTTNTWIFYCDELKGIELTY